MLQRTCKDFVDAEIKPIASDIDKNKSYPREQIKKMGDLGLMSVPIPEEYGGCGLDYMAYSIAVEEISRGSVANNWARNLLEN